MTFSVGNAPETRFKWIETVLSVAGAALGLVATIGFPAVAFQLARFGVPIGYASYNDILRAGVLPSLGLVAAVAYGVVALKLLLRFGPRKLVGLHGVLLLPLVLPAYVVLLVGGLSYALIIIWAELWLFRWVVQLWCPIAWSNRQLLVAAAILIGVCAVFWVFAWIFVLRKGTDAAPAKSPETSEEAEKAEEAKKAEQGERAANDPSATSAEPKSSDEPGAVVIGVIVTVMFFFVAAFTLYCTQWLLRIWDPALGHLLPPTRIWPAALAVAVIAGIFTGFLFLFATARPVASASAAQRWAVIIVAAVVYVAFAGGYWMWGYPRLGSGLGGGKPAPLTLWVKPDDAADDVAATLHGAHISTIGKSRRIDGLFVLIDREHDLVLTDRQRAPARALALSRDRIVAISW